MGRLPNQRRATRARVVHEFYPASFRQQRKFRSAILLQIVAFESTVLGVHGRADIGKRAPGQTDFWTSKYIYRGLQKLPVSSEGFLLVPEKAVGLERCEFGASMEYGTWQVEVLDRLKTVFFLEVSHRDGWVLCMYRDPVGRNEQVGGGLNEARCRQIIESG